MVIILFEIVRLVLVDEVSLGLHRLFGIEIGRQNFIVNVDEFERLFGDGLGRRHNARHIVTYVADSIESEWVFVVAHREECRTFSEHLCR